MRAVLSTPRHLFLSLLLMFAVVVGRVLYTKQRLLPEGVEVPGSFETIGHVAHVNLRDETLPYKKTIGRVLLDKNMPRIRTVINKVRSFSQQYPHRFNPALAKTIIVCCMVPVVQ